MNTDKIQKIFFIFAIAVIILMVAAVFVVPVISSKARLNSYRKDETKKTFVEKIDKINNMPESSKSTNEYIDLGNSYYALGEHNSAISAYREAASKTDDYSPTAYANIGNAYLGMKNYTKAQEAYLKSIEQDPGQPQVYLNLVEIYKLPWEGKKYDGEQILLKGLEYKNADVTLLSNLANYYKDGGNREKAIEYFEKALKASPSNEAIKRDLEALKAQ
jgi:tetratricopeptide (TPR) repeat protein